MVSTVSLPRLRPRPAHPPGQTQLAYTPDGRRLVTVGVNTSIRVYTTGSDGEPVNIDNCQENNTAVVASNDFFITGSEDGTVCQYSLQTHTLDKILVRCTLPVRDLALSPDGKWAAVASDELVVKVVNTDDMTRVIYLREQAKPVKHISFHPNGLLLAVSCTDGIIYFYSLESEQEPELVRKVDGVIWSLETDAEPSSRVVWHPDGRAFAAPTPTRDIQVMSRADWAHQRVFTNGHQGDVTALAWSPNGALLISAGADRQILLWETKTQTVLCRYDYANVTAFAWHPTENLLSFCNTDGEVYISLDFVPPEHSPRLYLPPQPAPFIHDPLGDDARTALPNRSRDVDTTRRRRGRTPDSLDDILGSDMDEDGDDFIIDDDGGGYADAVNAHGKRSNGHLDASNGPDGKRRATYGSFTPRLHESFQPGSTPWRGNRRYLCLNLIGFVWTVDQDTHHTITVEFYDREYHRDFHFTDPYLYDKACLTEEGTLFSCPPTATAPAHLFYRPHSTWHTRSDFRTPLPANESVTALSLTSSHVIAATSANYIRVYSPYGTPLRVHRAKSGPTVTIASWRDYLFVVGNGPVSAASTTPQLRYTIEDLGRDEVCQADDVVALPPGGPAADGGIRTAFFSAEGDPCVYDAAGTLLVLVHWRTPGQARWVPVLDTTRLARRQSGRKQERYWPVAVAGGRFHCIILKGGDTSPYFPRPLLSEFALEIPLGPRPAAPDAGADADAEEDGDAGAPAEVHRLEQSHALASVVLALEEDALAATEAAPSHMVELGRRRMELDKLLLQLLAVECREGEERGMKALDLVRRMRDQSGKMVEAAGKVAGRYERRALEGKIREVAERRLLGEGAVGDSAAAR